MAHRRNAAHPNNLGQAGFSLIELLIVLAIVSIVSGIVLSMMFDMTRSQTNVTSRSQMHSAVRSATEILQQEISQAGRITFTDPGYVTLSAAVPGGGASSTVAVSSGADLFTGVKLIVGSGNTEEFVTATAVSGNTFTAIFNRAHAANELVRPAGAFATGIVPTSVTDGSDGYTLKIYGDVNDDGDMVMVVYRCTPDDTGDGTLTRQQIPYNYTGAASDFPEQTLLPNLLENPDGSDADSDPDPCFAYKEENIGIGVNAVTFVTNIAVTLTTRSQTLDVNRSDDPATSWDDRYYLETKALLNVSPRNVFEAWYMTKFNASAPSTHLQPMPATVTSMLAYTN